LVPIGLASGRLALDATGEKIAAHRPRLRITGALEQARIRR
jgi:hypothetical protein